MDLSSLVFAPYKMLRLLLRDTLSHSAKDLIESSRRAALASCMEKHQLMQVYLQQRLQDIVSFCSIQPSRLPALLQQLLGALELARAELTWYFCHFDEVRISHAPCVKP